MNFDILLKTRVCYYGLASHYIKYNSNSKEFRLIVQEILGL